MRPSMAYIFMMEEMSIFYVFIADQSCPEILQKLYLDLRHGKKNGIWKNKRRQAGLSHQL